MRDSLVSKSETRRCGRNSDCKEWHLCLDNKCTFIKKDYPDRQLLIQAHERYLGEKSIYDELNEDCDKLENDMEGLRKHPDGPPSRELALLRHEVDIIDSSLDAFYTRLLDLEQEYNRLWNRYVEWRERANARPAPSTRRVRFDASAHETRPLGAWR